MPQSVAVSYVIAILCLVAVDASAPEWQSRIVGGSNATGNICPHAVAIRLVGKDFLCNGALISNRDVLTAAQCVYNGNAVRNASEFQVILGSLANANSSGATVHSVAAVWPHPQYTPSAPRLNDVAVLRLNGTVQSSASIGPIQLATANAVVNRTCTMCGWGSNSTSWRPSVTLQRLDVRIQPSNATYCTRSNGNAALSAGSICAGDLAAGKGACTGDQGSPLMCDARLQGVLTVVGSGSSCGGLNETSIFVDAIYHRSWINNRTQSQEVPPGGGTGGGGGGTGGGSGGGGGGGGVASHAIMQLWVVMMPIVVLFALK